MPQGRDSFDQTARIRYHDFAGWSSLVARRAHNPEVVGSNPTPATKLLLSKISSAWPATIRIDNRAKRHPHSTKTGAKTVSIF
jgi:hypothetical protein